MREEVYKTACLPQNPPGTLCTEHLRSIPADVDLGVHGQVSSEVDHYLLGFLNIQG